MGSFFLLFPESFALFCDHKLWLFRDGNSSCNCVNILQMAAKISTLSEKLFANFTLIRPLHGVLAEVVSQITALSEDCLTSLVLAAEIELRALGFAVEDFYRLVPLFWNSIKMLGKGCFAVYDYGTFSDTAVFK